MEDGRGTESTQGDGERGSGAPHPAVGVGAFLLFVAAGWIAAAVLVAPLPDTAMPWRAVISSLLGVVVATWAVVRWVDRRSFTEIGLGIGRWVSGHLGYGLLWGAALFAAGFALVAAGGAVRFTPEAGTALGYLGALTSMLLFFTVAAAAEEVLFRGYALRVLSDRWGPAVAVLITSVLFGLAHAANPEVTPLALFNIFLAGLWLGLAVVRTGSLWFAIGLHTGWNWAMAALFDVPVSGLTQGFDTPLYSVMVGGPEWWTGGGFGPEGGVAALIALAAATLWMGRGGRIPGIAAQAERRSTR